MYNMTLGIFFHMQHKRGYQWIECSRHLLCGNHYQEAQKVSQYTQKLYKERSVFHQGHILQISNGRKNSVSGKFVPKIIYIRLIVQSFWVVFPLLKVDLSINCKSWILNKWILLDTCIYQKGKILQSFEGKKHIIFQTH